MVQKKSNRLNWNEDDSKAAIKATEAKKMSWMRAFKALNVPFGTLRMGVRTAG